MKQPIMAPHRPRGYRYARGLLGGLCIGTALLVLAAAPVAAEEQSATRAFTNASDGDVVECGKPIHVEIDLVLLANSSLATVVDEWPLGWRVSNARGDGVAMHGRMVKWVALDFDQGLSNRTYSYDVTPARLDGAEGLAFGRFQAGDMDEEALIRGDSALVVRCDTGVSWPVLVASGGGGLAALGGVALYWRRRRA